MSSGINNLIWKTADPLQAGWWAIRRSNNDPDDPYLYEYWDGAMLGNQESSWTPMRSSATLYGAEHAAKDLAETMARADRAHVYFVVRVGVKVIHFDVEVDGEGSCRTHLESQLEELEVIQLSGKKPRKEE